MKINLKAIQYALPLQLEGIKVTIYIAVIGLIFALMVGFVVGFCLTSKNKLIKILANIYIRIFRNTPFMIQVYVGYFVLPSFGLKFTAMQTGIVCLILYMSSYMSVVVQAGIQSVPKGQYEAAEVLRIPYVKMLFRIILPQIMRNILPSLTNLLMTGLKETSVLSVITVGELMMQTKAAVSYTYVSMEIYIMAALMYWVLNLVISYLSKILEKKLAFYG